MSQQQGEGTAPLTCWCANTCCLSGLGFGSWGTKNGGQHKMEEGDPVDKLWIKDDILDLHTSFLHPPHTRNWSVPFSLSLLPSVESSLPLSVSLCVREETAASYGTCPGVPGHRKEQNSPLEYFSIERSLCDGVTLQLQGYMAAWETTFLGGNVL